MSKKIDSVVIDGALRAIFPSYSLAKIIYEKVSRTDVSSDSGQELMLVRAETERQENEMRRLEAQAKVAQEMAIASRIERASEVQIEEFYDYSGDGKVGINMDEKSISAGASVSGRRISKRIYKFTGLLTLADLADPGSEKVD
jgi:hypothetical protein